MTENDAPVSTSIVSCCLSTETVVYNGGLDNAAGIVNSVYSLLPSCSSFFECFHNIGRQTK